MASGAAVVPSASRPRPIRMRRSSGPRGSSRNSVERLRNGGLTSKNGFSVVAPISTSVPSSTAGSRASCWALVKRWISSRNRIVPWSRSPRRWRARSMTSRTSLTPAVTAESCSKARAVVPATASASVVLPVPGGPHNSTDESLSCSTRRRSGRPGPSSCAWPTTSSIVRGRNRAANGAWARRRSAAAAVNRSSATAPDRSLARGLARLTPEHLAVGRPLELDDVLDEPRRLDPLPGPELATVGPWLDGLVAHEQLEPAVDLTEPTAVADDLDGPLGDQPFARLADQLDVAGPQ